MPILLELWRAVAPAVADLRTTVRFSHHHFWSGPIGRRRGHLAKLFNKGEPTQCGNYRGPLAGTEFVNVFTSVMPPSVLAAADKFVPPTHCGCMIQRTTAPASHTTRTCLVWCKQRCLSAAAVCADLCKVLDKVIRQTVLGVTLDQNRGCPRETTRATLTEFNVLEPPLSTHDEYIHTSGVLFACASGARAHTSDLVLRSRICTIHTSLGVRQGSKFGALIFNLAHRRAEILLVGG